MKRLINLLLIGMLLLGAMAAWGESNGEALGTWYKANDLAGRLKGEKWKYGEVKKEIGRLQMAVEDLKEIQSYPMKLTHLNTRAASHWEKVINRIIKRSDKAMSLLEDMEKPLKDAINITKEMLKECPNLDMMDLLINDNVQRIKKLIKIKKYVERQWEDITGIMRAYEKLAGIPRKEDEKKLLNNVFFRVLISQTGQSSDFFYKDLHDYKDFLARKASESECVLMAKMDFTLMKKRLEIADHRRLQKDLTRTSKRYNRKIPIGSVFHLLGTAYLMSGNFHKSIAAYSKVTKMSSHFSDSKLGVLQALFELGRDDSLVTLYKSLVSDKMLKAGRSRAARYLAVQSLYELRDDEGLEAMILSFEKKDRFYYKSLFIYAKSLIRQRQDNEASEIFKSIIKQTQLPDKFKRDARLALAYLKYEQGYYQSALEDLKFLIDKPGYQPQAFYGLAWCYIKLKDSKTAQFTLKKLINQYPDSPLAIEGLLTLSRWQFKKATALWDYKKVTDLNRNRLLTYKKKIEDKLAGGRISGKLAAEISRKLSPVEMKIASRLKVPMGEIDSLFREALFLNEFILEHYATGVFSEVTFSSKRERALRKLEAIERQKGAGIKSIRQKALQTKIYKARQLQFDMTWYYKNWLMEYLAVMKESDLVASQARSAGTGAADSLVQSTEEDIRLNPRLKEDVSRYSQKCLEILDLLLSDPLSASHRDKILFYKGLVLFESEKNRADRDRARYSMLDSLLPETARLSRTGKRGYHDNRFEKIWMLILREYPDSDFIPLALYYLGQSQILQNDSRGLTLLEDFLEEFPKHRLKAYSLTLIGDYYFNRRRLSKATKFYHKILQFPSSKYFDKALYMQAWTYYTNGQYEKALKAFKFIMEEEMTKFPLTQLYKSSYFNEVLKMMANNFAELDTTGAMGNGTLTKFIQEFNDRKLASKILHSIAVVLRQQGRLAKSRRILQSLIKKFPDFEDIPQVMMDLAVSYDIENQYGRAVELREKVFQDYNRNGEWYAGLTDGFYKDKADSLCRAALDKIAFHYFAQGKIGKNGQKSSDRDSILNKTAYMKAITAYERFLEIYPDYKDAAKTYYLLAESYFEIKRYDKAAFMYLKASITNDKSLHTAAAYNAVIAAQKNVKNIDDEL